MASDWRPWINPDGSMNARGIPVWPQGQWDIKRAFIEDWFDAYWDRRLLRAYAKYLDLPSIPNLRREVHCWRTQPCWVHSFPMGDVPAWAQEWGCEGRNRRCLEAWTGYSHADYPLE